MMVLIVICLFNSLRITLIIWLTVPLSIIGIVIGLLIFNQPFGFMALLGALSLSGMLIKNGIVLIDEINKFEKKLVDSGMTLVKVAMFVSLEQQKKQLRERLEDPTKYWKYNPKDIDERQHWPAYQEAYQAVLDRTSTDYAPWYVVPSDKRWYSRLAITELLIEALKRFNLSWPPADFDIEAEKKRLADA